MSFESDVSALWGKASAKLEFSAVVEAAKGALSRGICAEDLLCGLRRDQLLRWGRGENRLVEDYLGALSALPGDRDWRLELAIGELEARRSTQDPLTDREIQTRFPDLSQTLRSHGSAADVDQDITEVIRISDSEVLQGRYRLDRLLGQGSFGRVFLARDLELQRDVAVKIPSEERLADVGRRREYLREARLVAGLEHPNILPIYDVGKTDTGAVYLVTRYIEGETLGGRFRRSRPTEREGVQLLIPVIAALGHAHRQGCVHRDVKPDNILIESRTGSAFLADFGLAIQESEYLQANVVSGTPAYMSPEQVCGEGHRLDGRSDLFSMGVILYELLTGEKPFRGGKVSEVLRAVRAAVVRPPQEVSAGVSSELQRICLKALSRLATERYQTAAELIEDLQLFLQPGAAAAESEAGVLPRGLRSFESADSVFFLSLLPGLRNRQGLPESVAFWKVRLEERNSSKTFSVGLLYGPSGCGKSSLVRAGVIPRLGADVHAICVDASATGTEDRLREAVQSLVPAAVGAADLVESLAILRRCGGGKVVIFLDQFEQWLSGNAAAADSELVLALRQCDGSHLQAVLMIRDDFALAAGRFMRLVESRLVEGWNFAAVDLFDTEHTERVLGMLGRAYGRLPERADELTQAQSEFLRSAARLLARDGRVISVHVSVFAEMMRRRIWSPESLQEVGGAEGVGVSFLEQMFCGREANPEYRLHAEGARRVLKSMLPGVDREIRGVRRTLSELREASCYAGRAEEFAELLRILEQDLRLVTVTESPGGVDSKAGESGSEIVCYQLTHDFLVPSLRTWLSQKQRETVEGRVELMLEDRAAAWNARQQPRQLPSLWEWLEILRRTDRSRWEESQRRMMQVAGRRHMRRSGTVLSVLLICLLCGFLVYRRAESSVRQREMVDLVQGLRDARAAAVPMDIESLKTRVRYAVPELRRQLQLVQAGTDQQLNLAAGLVALGEEIDPELLSAIEKLLLACRVEQLPVMAGIFRRLSEALRPGLLGVLSSGSESSSRRLNAACLISTWLLHGSDAEAESAFGSAAEFLALELVKQRPTDVPALQELLSPAFPQLLPILTRLYSGNTLGPLQRAVALGVLADVVREDAAALAELVLQSGVESFGVLMPALERLSDGVISRLQDVVAEKATRVWGDEPLGTDWQDMSAGLRRELESCGGVVNDRSAMCLSLAFDRFLEIAEELRECGYRPVRVRQVVTAAGGAARVSVVWRRDGGRWRLQVGQQAEQLPGPEDDAVLDGLLPEEVSYVSGKGMTGGWLVLWSEPVESGERRRYVAGLTAAELRAVERMYSEGGFGLQLSLSVRLDEVGVRRYGAVFSSQKVWSRSLTAYDGYEVLEIPQRDCAVAATGYEVSEDARERHRRQLLSLQGLSAAVQATVEFRQARAEVLADVGDALNAVSDMDAVMSLAVSPKPELLMRYLILLSLTGRAEDAAVVLERMENSGTSEEVLAAARVMSVSSRGESEAVLAAADRAEALAAGNGKRLFELSEFLALSSQSLRRRNPPVDSAAVLERGFGLLRAAMAAGFSRGADLADSTAWAEYREDIRYRDVLSLLRQREVLAGLWFAEAGLESRLVRVDTVSRAQEEVAVLCADGWRPVSAGLSEVGSGDCVVLLQRPGVKPELVEVLTRRQSLAQLLLLRLGAAEDVWQVLEDGPDPRVRTGVLHGLSAAGVSAETLLGRLSEERSIGIRRGLIQGLGELVSEGGVSADLRQRIVSDLLVRLVNDADPGVHAMCFWTLQRCGAAGEVAASLQSLATGRLEGGRGWYLTKTKGDTAESRPHILAVVDGRSGFLMGSPIAEVGRLGGSKAPNQEPLHRRKLNHRFAIGMLEVDVTQYRAFKPRHTDSAEFSRSDDNPANRVTWYAAAEFCNWLSAREGIPEDQWCYNPGELFASGMTLKPGFTELTGYRLPTSAEWELACRAGTTTSRYFGETSQFLSMYAWWNGNMQEATLKPCGQLRPNPFGLFDVYGNVNEWVSDEAGSYPFAMVISDTREPAGSRRVSELRLRMCRGASFGDVAGPNRSAATSARQPGILSGQQGFRVVRTLPDDWPE